MAINMTINDPAKIASQLATAYMQNADNLLATQTQAATATSTGLSKLKSALQTFTSALASLSSTSKKSLAQYSATFDTATFGSATGTAGAIPGTYSVFVQQLATANQIAYSNLPGNVTPSAAGKLTINLGVGTSFEVDFSTADTDGDNALSPTEIARAINQASDNSGKVTATLVTVGGQNQLTLTAGSTGAASQITLNTAQLDAGLANVFGAGVPKVPAQDAIVYFGGNSGGDVTGTPPPNGMMQQQASNTFTNIPGVSMTFTQAQMLGSAPLKLTVASDPSGTAANVQKFVDAYNALEKALDSLTATASPDGSTQAGAFATDAGVRALRSSLADRVRQQVGGVSLMSLGINIDRYGTMSLDQSKLQAALDKRPDALDTVFGNTGLVTSSGVLGSLDKYMQSWLNVSTGQIQSRQNSLQKLQKSIQDRQTRLDNQYNQAYNRYLKQFTVLQTLQAQMSQTTDAFASLFPSQSGN